MFNISVIICKMDFYWSTILKKNILRIICSFFLVLLFFSCATTVKADFMRPAKLDLNGAKTISVLPFKPSSYYSENYTFPGMKFVINSFSQIFDINNPDEQLILDILHNQIEKGLISSPYIDLVNSDAVEKAIRSGNKNPADVYFIGEVSRYEINDKKREEKKLIKATENNQDDYYATIRYWHREVLVIFRYQIVDTASQKIIALDELRFEKSSEEFLSKKDIPGVYSLIEDNLNSAVKKILQEPQTNRNREAHI